MSNTNNSAKSLSILSIAYRVFDQTKKSRTFLSMGREFLDSDFSSRGIYQRHQLDFYKYMDNHFTNASSDKNAVAVYGKDKVDAYIEALNNIVTNDPEMLQIANDLIAKEKNTTKVLEQVNEAIEEIENEGSATPIEQTVAAIEPAAPEETVAEVMQQEKAPKVDKPNYGLGFDLDSIMYHASIQFLTSKDSEVLKFVQDEIKKELTKNTLVVLGSGDNKKANVVKGRLHKDFKEVLEIVSIEKQAFLGGAAGTGKTTLAAQVAEALGVPYAHISCTAGMSEAHLLGRMVANGDYIKSNFVELYENGGVFLADEVDAADANTLLILNSALANGYISVPNRASNPSAKRHKDFYMICAGNTFGNGSNEYTGREVMDAAFMDRFAASKLHVDYDKDLEKEICKNHPTIANTIWKIRDNVKKNKLRRVVSTRVFVSAVKQLEAGRSADQFFDRFFTGWSNEEIQKAIQ